MVVTDFLIHDILMKIVNNNKKLELGVAFPSGTDTFL